jgi:hypothetical protein
MSQFYVLNFETKQRAFLKYSELSCPSATSSITDLTLPDLGSNSGSRCEKPALWHGSGRFFSVSIFSLCFYNLCQLQDDKYISSVNKM